MTQCLFLTADQVGIQSGGGLVTQHELNALQSIGETQILSRKELQASLDGWDRSLLPPDPFHWDKGGLYCFGGSTKLMHVYAGTFSECVRKAKGNGTKVTYTAAAHDIQVSKREHERLGIPFDYKHLTDPDLWARYVRGYLEADVVVCPSSLSRDCMLSYGCKDVRIIPHGVHVPGEVLPVPEKFTVGYLGAVGPDKGLIYLLQAWKKLNYKEDEARLVLGGRDSASAFVRELVRVVYGGVDKVVWQGGMFSEGNPQYKTKEGTAKIITTGWIHNVSEFYNSISLYVQSSCSEGFGLEVLEATAHGRPVVCSRGAGAADVVPNEYRVDACNVDQLAERIDDLRNLHWDDPMMACRAWQDLSRNFTWDKIEKQYADLWRSIL